MYMPSAPSKAPYFSPNYDTSSVVFWYWKKCKNYEFYIHGSVHRNSILIRSNKMQQYVTAKLLYTFRVSISHHQEYIKLLLQLLVQVIVYG